MANDEDGNLIVVSNAPPVKHEWENREIKEDRVEGGLVSAVKQIMPGGGYWISYGRGEFDYDDRIVDPDNVVMVPEDAPEEKQYHLKRVDIDDSSYKDFYRGFANQAIWPVSHTFPNKANFEEDHWEAYKEVNRIYAEAVLDYYEPGDTIWLHDYHLFLAPKMIRDEAPEAKIGLFDHIPFPPKDSFERVPWEEEIMEGLSGADLLGFQTFRDRDKFLRNMDLRGADVDWDEHTYEYKGEETQVGDYPIGIDFDFFSPEEGELPEIKSSTEEIKEDLGAKRLVVGVDRLDYTKGIPEKLLAMEELFDNNPKYIGEVSLFQRVPISRFDVPGYEEEFNRINEITGRINGEISSDKRGWQPIYLEWEGVPQEELIEEYQAGDVGLVTPKKDGMNLVSKEYVASNLIPKPLVLSEGAGSIYQLSARDEEEEKGAIVVHTNNIGQIARGIDKGLRMSESEKERRSGYMRGNAEREDVHDWTGNFVDDLDDASNIFH